MTTFARPWNGGIPKHGAEWVRANDSDLARRRFWLRVEIGGADECWLWHGSLNTARGYGIMFLRTNASVAAHRYSYFLKSDDLPSDQLIRHRCDNPRCVNPNHLLPGTHRDNALDAKERGRNTKGRKFPGRRSRYTRRPDLFPQEAP